MGKHIRPYANARTAHWASGTIPSGEHNGKRIDWEVYEAEGSKGHASGYQRIALAWLVVKLDGNKFGCWEYSGRNLDKASHTYFQNLESFRRSGGVPVIHI